MLSNIKFKAGIVRDLTGHASAGTWRDANLVRFRNGYPETMGGWQPVSDTAVTGTCRAMKYSVSLTGIEYHHLFTTTKWWVRTGGDFTDVTPIRETQALTNPFDTVEDSAVITVNDTSHGADDGDTVHISGSAAVGGVTPSGEYVITYVDANSYTITHSSAATSTVNGGGGATVSIDYEINIGASTAVPALGWGADAWGDGGWGDPASASFWSTSPRVWSVSQYGEDIVATPGDGNIFLWDATSPTARAVALEDLPAPSQVPVLGRIVLTDSKTRQLIVFGVNENGGSTLNPLHIRWSDNESLVEWNPDPTNNSGDITVAGGIEIKAAIEAKNEILFWTQNALWSLARVGGGLVYSLLYIGGSLSCAGKNAVVVLNDAVFWFSKDGFYAFDGSAKKLACPVEDYFRGRLHAASEATFYATANPAEGEIMFFYRSTDGSDIDSYILYKPSEDVWSIGQLSRTSWISTPFEDYPVATDANGMIYYHEYGCADGSVNPAVALEPYIESAPFDDGTGNDFMFVSSVIPDITFFKEDEDAETPVVTMSVKGLRYPGAAYGTNDEETVTRTATAPVEQYTNVIYPRVRGRAIVLRCESSGRGYKWRLGEQRIQVRKDGRR